jgi:NAD(P)H-hydrate epimerase
MIPRRPADSNKGKNGHVLLVAGSRGMTGAAILSGLGALKVGAGLLTIALPKSARRIVAGRLPEAMTLPLPETQGGYLGSKATQVIRTYVRRRTITTLAAGPGLTVHPSIKNVIQSLLKMPFPIVLDADGINSVASKDLKGTQAIITPHPGEMGRLLGLGTKEIQKDRVAICRDTARNLGVVAVLKGKGTVVSDGARTMVNSTGNAAMAAGGMGDVLTGVIAGLLAQGLSLFDAACAGVYVHGLAGDLVAKGDRGLLASELADKIPHALSRLIS